MPMLAIAMAGLGASVGTALHNKKVQAEQMKRQKESEDQARKTQQELLAQLGPFGQQMMHGGYANMNTVSNLLNGQINNRQSAMQANAPLLNQMAQAHQGQVQAGRSLYPRGGQTASQAANQPYQFQGDINNVLFGARQNAIGQLGTLGANQASLGLGALGQGAGLTNSMLNYGLNAREQMFNQGAQLGQGLSSLLGQGLQYYMLNRSGQTQTPSPQMPLGTSMYSPYMYGSQNSPAWGNGPSPVYPQTGQGKTPYSPYEPPG